MIFSKNCFSKAVIFFCIALVYLSGCATTNGPEEASPFMSGSGADEKQIHIAVLPLDNMSRTAAPLKEIRQLLLDGLRQQGIAVLNEEILESFMLRHRLRYTGSINMMEAQTLKEETGAEAVLITSLELYDEIYPPKVALMSRLVSTGDNQIILWMDSIGLAGDDSPGILGLGLIKDPQTLLKKALQHLTGSLTGYLSDNREVAIEKGRRKFKPKISYQSPVIASDMKYTIAVIPLFNRSGRKYAGDIMMLHFVKHLRAFKYFNVIEPGIVRQSLLRWRVIMYEGLSLANTDLIFGRLDADLILTGMVMDYQDYHGFSIKPKVVFSTQLIERKSREVVWSSNSNNKGDDGVFFFDWGSVNMTHTMASQMVRSVVEMIAE